MKKKVLTLALAVAMLAIIVSGSLAYFTAEDEVKNTFTIGSVLIEIFENDEKTDSDTIVFDELLLPVVKINNPSEDQNYIPKEVKVQSTGENAAFIRTHLAIPTALVDYLILDVYLEDGWTQVGAPTAVTVEENGTNVSYTVYTYDYVNAVAPDDYTTDLLKGVYLASDVDIKDNPNTTNSEALEFCKPDGNGGYVYSGFVAHTKSASGYTSAVVNVLVASQAIQSQGFEQGATNALDAGFGSGTNPWQ